MSPDHDRDDDITPSPNQSPTSRDRTAAFPQRGRVEPAKPGAKPATDGNREGRKQQEQELPPATPDDLEDDVRPGQGASADRSGKTYEGKTGVSGETSATDDEI